MRLLPALSLAPLVAAASFAAVTTAQAQNAPVVTPPAVIQLPPVPGEANPASGAATNQSVVPKPTEEVLEDGPAHSGGCQKRAISPSV